MCRIICSPATCSGQTDLNMIRQLFSGALAGRANLFCDPDPERPVCIAGDLHGRADLLDRLLNRLAAQPGAADCRLIFAGDMIDRGPGSAEALQRLFTLCDRPAPFESVSCLMGNHERMMLDFLRAPEKAAGLWLANGGDATLQSFGIDPYRPLEGGRRDPAPLRDALLQAIAPGLLDWLQNLPLLWSENNLAVVHAGADPRRPLPKQDSRTLIWGHPAFARRLRRDGIWIVHGHTVVANPGICDGRISVDTGAWRSGRLSAAWIERGGIEFITVSNSED